MLLSGASVGILVLEIEISIKIYSIYMVGRIQQGKQGIEK
jgi:hypothetical protein